MVDGGVGDDHGDGLAEQGFAGIAEQGGSLGVDVGADGVFRGGQANACVAEQGVALGQGLSQFGLGAPAVGDVDIGKHAADVDAVLQDGAAAAFDVAAVAGGVAALGHGLAVEHEGAKAAGHGIRVGQFFHERLEAVHGLRALRPILGQSPEVEEAAIADQHLAVRVG